MVKEPAASARRCMRRGFNPWVRKIPPEKEMATTPVFLPAESHGQRSLADDSPWGCKSQHDSVTKQLQIYLYLSV